MDEWNRTIDAQPHIKECISRWPIGYTVALPHLIESSDDI
jgi:hypothetical protein